MAFRRSLGEWPKFGLTSTPNSATQTVMHTSASKNGVDVTPHNLLRKLGAGLFQYCTVPLAGFSDPRATFTSSTPPIKRHHCTPSFRSAYSRAVLGVRRRVGAWGYTRLKIAPSCSEYTLNCKLQGAICIFTLYPIITRVHLQATSFQYSQANRIERNSRNRSMSLTNRSVCEVACGRRKRAMLRVKVVFEAVHSA